MGEDVSGGELFGLWAVEQIADQIDRWLDSDAEDSRPRAYAEQGDPWADVVVELRRIARDARRTHDLLRSADLLLSGDYGAESFILEAQAIRKRGRR